MTGDERVAQNELFGRVVVDLGLLKIAASWRCVLNSGVSGRVGGVEGVRRRRRRLHLQQDGSGNL